jgi:hypothetical protein
MGLVILGAGCFFLGNVAAMLFRNPGKAILFVLRENWVQLSVSILSGGFIGWLIGTRGMVGQ